MSSPPRAQITSAWFVPVIVSFPAVPMIVQPWPLLTVVDVVATFGPLGSGSTADAVAVAPMTPVAPGSTRTATVADAPAASVPTEQVTVVPTVHVPWLGV